MIDKRTKWLIKGIDLIIEQGFEGFNVDALCERMNIAKTSFYFHFISRDIFLKELIKFWANDLAPKVIEAIQNSAVQSLNSFLDHKITYVHFYCFFVQVGLFVKDKPDLARIVDKVDQELMEVTDSFLIAYIGKSIDRQVKTLVHTFLSGWDLINGFKIFHKEIESEVAIEQLKGFFINFSQNKSQGLLAS